MNGREHFRLRRSAIAFAALCLTAWTCTGKAEEPAAVDWQPYFRHLARSYRIAADSQPENPFVLHEPPVLRWSQPVRGGDDGAVYVWLQDGEPAAIGTMFCWPHSAGYRVVVNEFHSLITEPLTAVRDGTPAWAPREEGITWKPFDKSPEPAASPAARLLQMRQLAGRFRGENLDDSTGKAWDLRLMPTPVFRFDLSAKENASQRDVLDGAIFSLASGTDPEIFILLSARSTQNGRRWHWALARFSDRPLKAWLDESEVFSVPRARPAPSLPHAYFDVDQIERPPEIPEDKPATATP
jgi:hypothetical protein